MGSSRDVSDAVVFLSSERPAFVMGELLHLNGGAYMA